MTKKTLSFDQDFIKQSSFFTLPDSSPANRPADVDTPYITNPFPTIEVDKISLQKGESMSVDVNLSAVETVAGNPNLKTSWFSNKEFVNSLRVRILACFDDTQTEDLDFIVQRINEYQAGLMDTKGPVNSDIFLGNLVKQGDDNTFPLLSSDGPFDVNQLTEIFKNTKTQRKLLSINGGEIYVYDAPINSLFVLGDDGIPKNVVSDTNPVVQGKILKSSNTPKYKKRVITLAPVQMQLSKSVTTVEQVSFYVMVYNDKYELLKSAGVDIQPEDTSFTDILQNGLSFISSNNYLGQQTVFEKQVKGSPPTAKVPRATKDSPENDKFVDKQKVDLRQRRANPSKLIRSSINNDINSTPSLKIGGQLIKTDGYFSSLWTTKADGDSARFGFVFDKKRLLASKMLFPYLVTNELSSQEILTLCYPLDVQMKKRRVHYKGYTRNSVGTSTRSIPYELSCYDPEEIIGAPITHNIYMGKEDNLSSVFYQGYDTYEDLKKSQTIIKNQYGVSIYLRDPSIDYIKNSIISLRSVEDKLKRMADAIRNNPQPLSVVIDNYTKIPFHGSTIAVESRQVISQYLKYYNIFKEEPEIGNVIILSTEMEQSMMYANLTEKGLKGFSDLIASVQKLVDSLETIIKAYLPKDSYNQGDTVKDFNIMQKGPAPTKVSIIEVHHYFSDLFEFGRQCNTGYNYVVNNEEEGGFPKQTRGLTSIRRDVYLDRITKEFNKYFGTYTTPDKPGTEANPFADTYENPSYSYLTPKTIQIHGEDPVNQIGVRNSKTNEIVFDIDNYARLFSNLIKVKRNTNYLNRPFYMSDKDSSLKDDLMESLLEHECAVEMGTEEQFTKLTIKNTSKRSIPSEISELKNIKLVSLNRELMPLIYGGAGDKSTSTTKFLRDISLKIKPTIFTQPSFFDLTAALDNKKGEEPIKILFALLGELEIKSRDLTVDYEKQNFNSLINGALQDLKLDSLNIKSTIEGPLSYLPNQTKSMFVLASSTNPEPGKPRFDTDIQLQPSTPFPSNLDLNDNQQIQPSDSEYAAGILGDGFDAMRFSLNDIDLGTSEQLISFVAPGVDKLPYKQTKDPMKVFAKFLTFWMNYKQICIVEYLEGFQAPDAAGAPEMRSSAANISTLKKMPIWLPLNRDTFEDNTSTSLLCRIRNISLEDLFPDNSVAQAQSIETIKQMGDQMDLFDLPIYNQYFLLSQDDLDSPDALPTDSPPTTSDIFISSGGQNTSQVTQTSTSSVSVVSSTSTSTSTSTGTGGY